jgi:DNA-binding MarR family transcriptional regulator
MIEPGADDESAPARAMDGLRRLVRVLRASNADAERLAGMTSAQLFVLKHIAAHPALSLRDVIRLTLTTQSTASEVVGRLVDRGFVSRTVSASDRRRVVLSATPRGREIVEQCGPPIQDMLINAFGRLPLADQGAVADGLAAWLSAAGLGDVVPSMFYESDAPVPCGRAPESTGMGRSCPPIGARAR